MSPVLPLIFMAAILVTLVWGLVRVRNDIARRAAPRPVSERRLNRMHVVDRDDG